MLLDQKQMAQPPTSRRVSGSSQRASPKEQTSRRVSDSSQTSIDAAKYFLGTNIYSNGKLASLGSFDGNTGLDFLPKTAPRISNGSNCTISNMTQRLSGDLPSFGSGDNLDNFERITNDMDLDQIDNLFNMDNL